MAITFADRTSDNPNRRKLTVVSSTNENITALDEIIVDVIRDEGTVSAEGTPLNATTLNTNLAQKTGTFTVDNLASFDDTSGTIENSGIAKGNVVQQTANGVTGNVPSYTGANKTLQNSGVPSANIVQQSANGYANNLPKYSGANKILIDSGVPVANVITQTANGSANQLPVYNGTNKVLQNSGINIGAVQHVDRVIRTQADFDAMISSGTWLDAKSVLIVGGGGSGTGGAYVTTAGITIPATVKNIYGINTATIIPAFIASETTILGYSTSDTANYSYSISGIHIILTNVAPGSVVTYMFRNMYNISNCSAIVDPAITITGSVIGFYYCSNVTNCFASIIGTSGTGFYYCNYLTNCNGTGSGFHAHGFTECRYVTNCIGTGTTTTGCAVGFDRSAYLTNCLGKGSKTSGEGYGFMYINRASNCSDNVSGTDMWGGTNNNIDIESCKKTLTTTSLTTLNA